MSMIYYLGYYDTVDNKKENRSNAPAASNKMSYVVSALEKNGYTVEVISPSATQNRCFYKGKVVPIGEHSRLKLFATWPSQPRLLRVLGRWLLKWNSFWYMCRKLKKEDTLIVYHSLALMKRVKWLKRLCRCKLILEIEEIYGDVMEEAAVSNRELAYFQLADGYLVPAQRLNQKVNVSNKPFAVAHGTYQAEPERQCANQFQEQKKKIHCVYAGTLDPRKGGAVRAAEAARYLPEDYHIHILGFGTEEQTESMKTLTESLNARYPCDISYDGCLKGEAYIQFLQSCHIGLSTQNPEGIYNDTSFPSKILSYMANGLQVVTVRIPVVEESAVHEYMCYCDEPTPEQLAKAICSATEHSTDGRIVLAKLDQEFVKILGKLLEEI